MPSYRIKEHGILLLLYFTIIMKQSDLQKRVEQFLNEIGVPGFIVFGYMEQEPNIEAAKQQLHIVSSFKDMPTNAAIKGLTRVVSDFANKAL